MPRSCSSAHVLLSVCLLLRAIRRVDRSRFTAWGTTLASAAHHRSRSGKSDDCAAASSGRTCTEPSVVVSVTIRSSILRVIYRFEHSAGALTALAEGRHWSPGLQRDGHVRAQDEFFRKLVSVGKECERVRVEVLCVLGGTLNLRTSSGAPPRTRPVNIEVRTGTARYSVSAPSLRMQSLCSRSRPLPNEETLRQAIDRSVTWRAIPAHTARDKPRCSSLMGRRRA